jgi:hypothetical protein
MGQFSVEKTRAARVSSQWKSTVNLWPSLTKLLAKRLSRCDESAENNRLGPVLKQAFQNLQQSYNLGIRRTTCVERFRHRDQFDKLGAFFGIGSCGSRFEITLIEKTFVLIKDDRLHCLFVRDPALAIAQRTRSSRRRRPHAAHKRERSPESQPPAPLVRASPLCDAKAIVQDAILEGGKIAGEFE